MKSGGAVWQETWYARKPMSAKRVRGAVHEVRSALRTFLGLPETLDPVPCVQSKPAAWSIYLPDYVLDRLREHALWGFAPDSFRLAGKWFPLESETELSILRLLAESPQPLTAPEIARGLDLPLSGTRIRVELGHVRTSLRRLIAIPLGVDPVPRTKTTQDSWTLYLTDEVLARIGQDADGEQVRT